MKVWENNQIDHQNRLPAHANYVIYPNRDCAIKNERYSYMSLNGLWKFKFYDAVEYIDRTWLLDGEAVEDMDDMVVPSNWQIQGYGKMHYSDLWYNFPINPPYVPSENPTGVYKKSFKLTPDFDDKRIILRFNGVDSAFHVYLNGQEIGYSKGARLVSEFDITNFLNKDAINYLSVVVYQWSDGTYLEDQDMWWLSGIFRDVEIIAYPMQWIKDFKIETALKNDYRDADLKINIVSDETFTYDFELYDNRHTLILAQSSKALSNTYDLQDIHLWSAEDPYLYTLYIIVKKHDQLIGVIKQSVGFKQIELKQDTFLVNGVAIKLKGVNHHDFNPKTGRVMSKEDYLKDIILMKQFNINTIRTSHYPANDYFYDLCDEYGMYVIDETDLECHGFELSGKYNWISNDPSWELAYTSRLERMIQRDKNHPCIIMYSLGNESSTGCNFKAMAKLAKQLDNTKLVHYEGDFDVEYSDVYSTMYTWLENDQKPFLMKDIIEKAQHPHILCEYAHAMGNGPGNLKDYQDLFYQYDKLQGGCVWEWFDHGIYSLDDQNREYYRYGGDFHDDPTNGDFCIDGLLMPNRTPSPGLIEYGKVIEPITTISKDLNRGVINCINRYDFIDLSIFDLNYTITSGEDILFSDKIRMPKIAARANMDIQLTYDIKAIQQLALCSDCYLNISYTLNRAMKFAGIGFELANAQFKLPITIKPHNKTYRFHDLKIQEDAAFIEIIGDQFKVSFDKVKGLLQNYYYQDQLLIEQGPKFSFYRATTSNDKEFINDIKKVYFLHLEHDVVQNCKVINHDNCLEVEFKIVHGTTNSAWHYDLYYQYFIYFDGVIKTHIQATPSGKLDCAPEMLPKLGFNLKVNNKLVNSAYYGLGKNENYVDSHQAAQMGIYRQPIEELFTNYVVPQANGNHMNCRWASLVDQHQIGLLIRNVEGFNFSASLYSDKQLDEAKHTNELKPEDYITLHIDYAQNGLGSFSCGQWQLEKYRTKFEAFEFSFDLVPLNRNVEDENVLGNIVIK